MGDEQQLAIDVQDLNFDYGGPPILQNLNLRLERGQRCLLVGANGAGKTTLLRILAGKRKVPGNVNVLGKNAFLDAPPVIPFPLSGWIREFTQEYNLTGNYISRHRVG